MPAEYFPLFVFFSAVVGLCIGSFLNVVVYRLPLGMSLAYPPSHCTTCGYKLKWYDNIPVVSYLMLGGKCRQCKAHISFRYTLVEILCAVLFTACAAVFGKTDVVYSVLAMAVYTSYPHSSDRYFTQNEVSKPPLNASTTFCFAMVYLLFLSLIIVCFVFVRVVEHSRAQAHTPVVPLQNVEVHATFASFPKGGIVG